MNPSAVIDNSSLVYLSHLHESNYIFNYLTNLFQTIYIPAQVVLEYQEGLIKEPHRGRILNRLNPDRGFFRFCNRYDSIVLAMIRDYKGIDKGEADTYAQLRKVNAHFIISDDKPFIAAILKLDKTTKVYTTLHLLCWLQLSSFMPDWKSMIRKIHALRPFKSNELRQAFLQVTKNLGLKISRKEISIRCSLTKILY